MKKLKWFPWNGSKRWLLPELETVFKLWDGQGRFIDPFVGGGSVSYLMRDLFSNHQIVADANPWLMSAYTGQQHKSVLDPDYANVERWRAYSDEDFNSLTLDERYTRFAVCLISAWGNRWETAPGGVFRSTVNPKYTGAGYLLDRLSKIFAVRWLTSGDQTFAGDWKAAVSLAESGDLVYLDPPYPESLGYGNQWWSFSDLLDLVDWISEVAIPRHIQVVVSNMSTVERLFRRIGMTTKIIAGPSSSRTRRKREEVLAWHFGTKDS